VRPLPLAVATLAAAALGAALFRALHLPLATILGAMTGAALLANLLGVMPGGRLIRRFGQLFVGASIGAVLSPDILGELLRLLPVMLGIAVAANLVGLVLAVPLAWLAGIDRLSAVLASLPAGMAEMATLAHALDADEQAVALIHTLRVVLVLTLLPLWLGLTGRHAPLPLPPISWNSLVENLALVVAAAALAALATRLQIFNAYIIAPMLVSLLVVAVGHRLPPVPGPVLVAAQVAIGASLGLRFDLARMGRLPRVALAGAVSSFVMIILAFSVLAPLADRLGGLDPVSSTLASAPGGLGEMIGSAASLGLLAAAVAGFQLARSLLTNLAAPPLIRWYIGQKITKRP
jgi:membrane AbrB-like protein